MDSYIIVRGNGRTIKVSADDDGTITEDTLRRAFLLEQDMPIGLYRNDIALNDWRGAEFELSWEVARRSRPPTPIPLPSTSAAESGFERKRVSDGLPIDTQNLNEKQKERINRLKNWMFYSILTRTEAGTFENVSKVRNCVTIAEKETALMAAHCLPLGVPEQFTFEIYSQEGYPHLVQVKYINRTFDFVVLKTVDKEFDTYPIGLTSPYIGAEYIVLRYHSYNYQTSNCLSGFFGRIRNIEHSPHLNFVLGSPGTTRGFSGAGAFSFSRLLGIVVSGRVSTQNVYSSTGSLSDHVADACVELAEPSYSHIVPSPTIFALFDEYIRSRT